MLCYVMLCYVMLCYVMLCYVMLCYVMLCYVMLCYVMFCLVIILYMIYCIILCYIILYKEHCMAMRMHIPSPWNLCEYIALAPGATCLLSVHRKTIQYICSRTHPQVGNAIQRRNLHPHRKIRWTEPSLVGIISP